MRLLLPSELVSNTFKLYCLQCCVGLEINHNDVFTKKCRKKNCALFNKHYELFQSENNHLFIVCLKCKTNIDITRYSNNDFFNYASFPTYKGYLYLRLSKIQKNRKIGMSRYRRRAPPLRTPRSRRTSSMPFWTVRRSLRLRQRAFTRWNWPMRRSIPPCSDRPWNCRWTARLTNGS